VYLCVQVLDDAGVAIEDEGVSVINFLNEGHFPLEKVCI
jgi:hypothetical protein